MQSPPLFLSVPPPCTPSSKTLTWPWEKEPGFCVPPEYTAFQNISALPAYKNWCAEELRMADYRARPGLQTSSNAKTTSETAALTTPGAPPALSPKAEPLFPPPPATMKATSFPAWPAPQLAHGTLAPPASQPLFPPPLPATFPTTLPASTPPGTVNPPTLTPTFPPPPPTSSASNPVWPAPQPPHGAVVPPVSQPLFPPPPPATYPTTSPAPTPPVVANPSGLTPAFQPPPPINSTCSPVWAVAPPPQTASNPVGSERIVPPSTSPVTLPGFGFTFGSQAAAPGSATVSAPVDSGSAGGIPSTQSTSVPPSTSTVPPASLLRTAASVAPAAPPAAAPRACYFRLATPARSSLFFRSIMPASPSPPKGPQADSEPLGFLMACDPMLQDVAAAFGLSRDAPLQVCVAPSAPTHNLAPVPAPGPASLAQPHSSPPDGHSLNVVHGVVDERPGQGEASSGVSEPQMLLVPLSTPAAKLHGLAAGDGSQESPFVIMPGPLQAGRSDRALGVWGATLCAVALGAAAAAVACGWRGRVAPADLMR